LGSIFVALRRLGVAYRHLMATEKDEYARAINSTWLDVAPGLSELLDYMSLRWPPSLRSRTEQSCPIRGVTGPGEHTNLCRDHALSSLSPCGRICFHVAPLHMKCTVPTPSHLPISAPHFIRARSVANVVSLFQGYVAQPCLARANVP